MSIYFKQSKRYVNLFQAFERGHEEANENMLHALLTEVNMTNGAKACDDQFLRKHQRKIIMEPCERNENEVPKKGCTKDSAPRFVHSLFALLSHSSWTFYRRESAESHKANTLSMHNIGTVQEHAASSSIAAVLHNVKGGRVGLDASRCIFEYTC